MPRRPFGARCGPDAEAGSRQTSVRSAGPLVIALSNSAQCQIMRPIQRRAQRDWTCSRYARGRRGDARKSPPAVRRWNAAGAAGRRPTRANTVPLRDPTPVTRWRLRPQASANPRRRCSAQRARAGGCHGRGRCELRNEALGGWRACDSAATASRTDGRRYQSEQFIEWFLEEQVEEESTMQDLLQVAERTREIPMLLEEYVAREHGD